MPQGFNPANIWKPFGAFSQMVIGGEGRVVYLKGQVALDREGEVVGIGDMRSQVGQVLENVKVLLASVNGGMSDVVALTQYTTNISEFMKVGDIRSRYFQAPYPVTTTVEVSALYDPALLVEISGIAEIPMERFHSPKEVHGGHPR